MKLTVRDQLHLSSVSPDTMAKGTEFEVSDALGKDLVKRGLADEVATTDPEAGDQNTDEPAEKAEAPHPNKAEGAAPANKASAKGKAQAKA